MSAPILIVNADDFGRSPAVNEGVVRCHREGIVTSASLMVRWPDGGDASEYARVSSLGVGLHLDLGEWIYAEGEWQVRYEVVPNDDAEEVKRELAAQLARFERLVGRPPDHLDSHQHVHRHPPVRGALIDCGERLGVPVRETDSAIVYNGSFYGQAERGRPIPEAIGVDALVNLIADLPEGITELACHPATADDHRSDYARERTLEVATLCDPRVRAEIERRGILLASFENARSL